MRTVAPTGSWTSPITAALIATESISLGAVALDGGDVYWTEGRPAEGGRVVLVRWRSSGTIEDVTPRPFNIRSRVHEYGGGAFCVDDGVVTFVNFVDQRLYRHRVGEQPEALTPKRSWRYADMILDRQRIIAVREDHERAGTLPRNLLVALNLHGLGEGTSIAEGRDFYSNPCVSPDGRQLAWLNWDLPNMPWDESELWLAELDSSGTPSAPSRVAGGPGESVFQPKWSPDGRLHFVSDRSGWWNLYRLGADGAVALCLIEAEFGLPQWVFGMSTYGFAADGRLVATYRQGGEWHLGIVANGAVERIKTPYTGFDGLAVADNYATFIGTSPREAAAVVKLDLDTGALKILRRAFDVNMDLGTLSEPQHLSFPTGGGGIAHGFYYPPTNKYFAIPKGELPPLIVKGHGGPTGAASTALSLVNQFWTSRGFALLDVDYRGSTGYGRAYREALYGLWGVADVEDCVAGAMHLANKGLADRDRLIIRGSSAGGYTTLAALTFRDVFRVGASHYGISDLEALAADTHKFESRYLDQLVGPYPQRRDLYRTRSPLWHADRLTCPVIFFQGLDDKVVPPTQAEAMVTSLKSRGVAVAYLAFKREGHGFRRAHNVRRVLEAELSFYGAVLGFKPADECGPLPIDSPPLGM